MQTEHTDGHAARETILEVVVNQIRENAPPETRSTFQRLQDQGHPPKEARTLIACVLAAEIYRMVKAKEGYDEARYINHLQQLPDLPWRSEVEN